MPNPTLTAEDAKDAEEKREKKHARVETHCW